MARGAARASTVFMSLTAPLSLGELIDRLTILEIKAQRRRNTQPGHHVELRNQVQAGLSLGEIARMTKRVPTTPDRTA